MELKRREGESTSAFLYRFSKKIQRSGVLLEVKKRRFKDRTVSKQKRRVSALHREKKKKEVERKKKLGLL